jgi:chaperonin GroEL (HSP60 family)
LVVRGTSNIRIEEIERCFEDAIQVACNLVESPQLLPGGGATQMALARRLRRHAETVPGREQLAIEAFAAALDSIPRILAENAGLSPLDESIRLNAAQDEGGDWVGLDLFAGEPRDMAEAGIVEPLLVTRHAIEGATEAAISVLRIDDVLWAEQDAQEPDWKTDDSDED